MPLVKNKKKFSHHLNCVATEFSTIVKRVAWTLEIQAVFQDLKDTGQMEAMQKIGLDGLACTLRQNPFLIHI